MRIGITGHTRGLGKAIHDHFAADHEVIGMSRQTGFDLSTGLEKVIATVQTCDLFFNNAHVNVQQGLLLSALHDKLPIITSGSMGADWPKSSRYGFHKYHVEQVFRMCAARSKQPMLLLKMGYLENFPRQRFIPFSDVLKAIDFWLDCPRVHVIQFDNGEHVGINKP
jgi:hypothetical protein